MSDRNATRATGDVVWTSRDGATLHLRPVRPDDFAIEQAFVDGLSFETGFRRLLSPRRLQPADIERFTRIDPAVEVALIAVEPPAAGGAMCGVARFVRSGVVAEWAIVLADRWQGRGLGRALLERLVDAARVGGIERLSDVTLATNAPMIALARALGFTVAREPRDATLRRLTLDLSPPATEP